MQNTELDTMIAQLSDPDSDRYGKLLHWQNDSDPFWHYGIGLSETHVFGFGQTLAVFEQPNAIAVTDVDHLAFPPKKTIARMKEAIQAFSDWNYQILGWNCEHFARLIATNQPRSYQSMPLWMICNLTPSGTHKTAYRVFHDHLMAVNPWLTLRVSPATVKTQDAIAV
jgi:hypothetical protein